MRKCLSVLIITALMIVLSFSESMAVDPSETVVQFFRASKSGDVETMKGLIAGPFYNKRRVLLEMNTNYPDFLKKFYDGATINPLHYEVGNDNMVKKNHRDLYNRHYSAPNVTLNKDLRRGGPYKVAVVIAKLQFPDGSRFNYKYLLKKVKNDPWKIYDEVLIRLRNPRPLGVVRGNWFYQIACSW